MFGQEQKLDQYLGSIISTAGFKINATVPENSKLSKFAVVSDIILLLTIFCPRHWPIEEIMGALLLYRIGRQCTIVLQYRLNKLDGLKWCNVNFQTPLTTTANIRPLVGRIFTSRAYPQMTSKSELL